MKAALEILREVKAELARDKYAEEMAAGVIEESQLAAMVAGMRRFAWWKDGVQYVGTCGTTLEKAIADVETEVAGWRDEPIVVINTSTLTALEAECESLRAFKRSVDEALNTGDGSYRP